MQNVKYNERFCACIFVGLFDKIYRKIILPIKIWVMDDVWLYHLYSKKRGITLSVFSKFGFTNNYKSHNLFNMSQFILRLHGLHYGTRVCLVYCTQFTLIKNAKKKERNQNKRRENKPLIAAGYQTHVTRMPLTCYTIIMQMK